MSRTSISKFMNTKSFHPSTFHNQKRVWIAEQKAKQAAKKQREIDREFAREQTIRDTKAFVLTGTVSEQERQRLEVGFMYDAPPGTEKKPDAEDGETKLELDDSRKLSMQEKFDVLKGAPRESYAKDLPARDRPFGIEVRNVRCLRCQAWGHQSTDRVCPRFGQPLLEDAAAEVERPAFEDPAVLMREMKSTGLSLTRRVLGRANDPTAANQQLLPDEPEDEDLAFLAGLTETEKLKLIKKLNKMEKKEKKKKKHKKEKKSKKKSKKHKGSDDSDGSDDEDDDEDDGQWMERPTTGHAAHSASASSAPAPAPAPAPASAQPLREESRSHSQSHPRNRSPSPTHAHSSSHRRRSRSPVARSHREHDDRHDRRGDERRSDRGGEERRYDDRRRDDRYDRRRDDRRREDRRREDRRREDRHDSRHRSRSPRRG